MASFQASAGAVAVEPAVAGLLGARVEHAEEAPRTFDAVYERYFDFVWRNIRRLGVPEPQIDDAVQEVFLVVHRRFGDIVPGASCRAWIFGILIRVVQEHRRRLRRKSPLLRTSDPPVDPDELEGHLAPSDEQLAHGERVRLLHRLLDDLDDDKRAVFVLAEFEQMTAPEIASMLGANVNTVYARLRAARKDFELGAARLRARDSRRQR